MSAQGGEKEPFETAVLELLWDGGPKTPREVHSAIGEPRNWAYTTTLTLLHRLHARHVLGREKVGRTHRYSPLVPREEQQTEEARRVAESLSRLGESGVAAFLAEARNLDPGLVERLRRQLEEGSP